ncbi:MAG: hypothetical protein ACLFVN_07550 [Phycisphaeraceae bacterium]
MILHELNYKGHFEDQTEQIAERLQLVEPENDLEKDLLRWVILPHAETITDDSARRGYAFQYEIGRYLQRGLYTLTVTARDRSDVKWSAEIAAAVASTGASAGGHSAGYTRFWFCSERLHFKPSDDRVRDRYPGESFGELEFNRAADVLPHARLFRATA